MALFEFFFSCVCYSLLINMKFCYTFLSFTLFFLTSFLTFASTAFLLNLLNIYFFIDLAGTCLKRLLLLLSSFIISILSSQRHTMMACLVALFHSFVPSFVQLLVQSLAEWLRPTCASPCHRQFLCSSPPAAFFIVVAWHRGIVSVSFCWRFVAALRKFSSRLCCRNR